MGTASSRSTTRSGAAHVYSTYLGGSAAEQAEGIAVDGAGDAFVTGLTKSTNFPTTAPFQPMSGGGDDGFVTRFNASGSAHVYSSYLGGGGAERGYAITTGGAAAYVTGGTTSTDFPEKSPLQADPGGGEDVFVSKIGDAPAGGTGPGGTTGADTTAPVLSRLALSPSVFRAASRGASIAARRHRLRTRVSYRLSEAATVTFAVERAAAGRRVGGRCVRPTRSNRNRRRCVRYVVLKGTFRHAGRAGANRFRFTGRLRNRRLRPASYRLRARATDPARNRSPLARKRFRVVRR